MREKIIRKLRSEKGASITFALLAFLVCAAISTVLLASAVAANGRLSGLTEADRRYYAVNSAAQLFTDAFNGKSFTVERIKIEVSTKATDYTIGLDGGYNHYGPYECANPDNLPPDFLDDPLVLKVKTPYAGMFSDLTKVESSSQYNNNLISANFPTEAALYYLFGDPNTASDPAYLAGLAFEEGTPETHGNTWNMTLSLEEEACPQVAVVAKLQENGVMKITFKNIPDEDHPEVFTASLFLKASMVASYPEVTESHFYGMQSIPNGVKELDTTKTVTTKRLTITWSFTELIKGVGEET